jgi:hypothetical protein
MSFSKLPVFLTGDRIYMLQNIKDMDVSEHERLSNIILRYKYK